MHRNVRLVVTCLAAMFASHINAQSLPASTKADRILVVKSTHTMTLYSAGKVLKTYRVSIGQGPGNAKQKKGDLETPEGTYTINGRNPHSSCYRALHISYPNDQDRANARKLHADPGGDVEIHGLPPGYAWIGRGQELADWTYGCIAVTNAELGEIWKLVPNGTPIEIRH